MMVGTLAIAGIFPLSGFFSKDEILFRSFLSSKVIWALAVVTAFMTAFYMFRLMSMTFFGGYRGPTWETAGHGHVEIVRRRGQYMQEAVPVGEGAMAAVLGLDPEQISILCTDAAQGEVVSAANLNGGGQVVIGGATAGFPAEPRATAGPSKRFAA